MTKKFCHAFIHANFLNILKAQRKTHLFSFYKFLLTAVIFGALSNNLEDITRKKNFVQHRFSIQHYFLLLHTFELFEVC